LTLEDAWEWKTGKLDRTEVDKDHLDFYLEEEFSSCPCP
jgi:hypothetical protein